MKRHKIVFYKILREQTNIDIVYDKNTLENSELENLTISKMEIVKDDR